jgi:hypothetical protein
MKLDPRSLVLALPVVLAACGGMSSGVDAGQIQAFSSTALAVSSAATTYGNQAATMTSASTCAADQSAYDGQVRPMVARMQGMAPAMDDMMGSMNHMADGDMACAAAAMMAELDRHGAVACVSTSDMGPNVAEAGQHVAAMTQWADHQAERAHEMGSMMGMSGMMGGTGGTVPTGHCVQAADGSYHLQ